MWYSETLANGDEFDGFLVEMPDNSTNKRWYVPGSPTSTSDNQYLNANARPDDAVQWDYHELYRRFTVEDVARYLFPRDEDAAAHAQFTDATEDVGGYGIANSNTQNICNAAKANDHIEVFTVAFEAPASGEAVLQDCASKPGNHFDVEGTQISDAFDAIAAQISQLRLTE